MFVGRLTLFVLFVVRHLNTSKVEAKGVVVVASAGNCDRDADPKSATYFFSDNCIAATTTCPYDIAYDPVNPLVNKKSTSTTTAIIGGGNTDLEINNKLCCGGGNDVLTGGGDGNKLGGNDVLHGGSGGDLALVKLVEDLLSISDPTVASCYTVQDSAGTGTKYVLFVLKATPDKTDSEEWTVNLKSTLSLYDTTLCKLKTDVKMNFDLVVVPPDWYSCLLNSKCLVR